jgi:hypothetical protein
VTNWKLLEVPLNQIFEESSSPLEGRTWGRCEKFPLEFNIPDNYILVGGGKGGN